MLEGSIKSWMKVEKSDLETELIVVDNHSKDFTRQVVMSFQDACTDLKYVFESRPGLSFARNKGIEEAEGDIVAFVDDDIYFHKNWLEEIIRIFRNRPEIDCVGGNSIPVMEIARPAWLRDNLLKLYGSTQSGESEKKMVFPEHPFGVNMAFRKEVFQHVGMFNTDLGRIKNSLLSNEEKEFFYRIHQSSLNTYYTPHAIVYHRISKDRLDQKWILRRIFWQGISKVAFEQFVQKKSKHELMKDIVRQIKRIIIGTPPFKWKKIIIFYPLLPFYGKIRIALSLGILKQSLLELMDQKKQTNN